MTKIKISLSFVLGLALFAALSLYQPSLEANAAAALSADQAQYDRLSFISPIPFDQLIGVK